MCIEDECFTAVDRAKAYNPKLLYHIDVKENVARITLKAPRAKEPFIDTSYEYDEGEDYSYIYIKAKNDIERKLKILGVEV